MFKSLMSFSSLVEKALAHKASRSVGNCGYAAIIFTYQKVDLNNKPNISF